MSKKKGGFSSEEYENYLNSLKAGEQGLDAGTGSTAKKGGQPMATNDQLTAAADPKKVKKEEEDYRRRNEQAWADSERLAQKTPRSFEGLPKTNLGIKKPSGWEKVQLAREERQHARNVIAGEKAARAARNSVGHVPVKKDRYAQYDPTEGLYPALGPVCSERQEEEENEGCTSWVMVMLVLAFIAMAFALAAAAQ